MFHVDPYNPLQQHQHPFRRVRLSGVPILNRPHRDMIPAAKFCPRQAGQFSDLFSCHLVPLSSLRFLPALSRCFHMPPTVQQSSANSFRRQLSCLAAIPILPHSTSSVYPFFVPFRRVFRLISPAPIFACAVILCPVRAFAPIAWRFFSQTHHFALSAGVTFGGI